MSAGNHLFYRNYKTCVCTNCSRPYQAACHRHRAADYDTTDALAAALSFPLALPQTLPDGYAFDSASDQFGMAVVVYADAEGHTLKYCMGKGEDALEGMNHAVSGEKLEGTDALLYAETGYTAVEWKDSKYSYCLIADEAFDTAVWQALVNSIK